MESFATLADVMALTGKTYSQTDQARISALLPLISDTLRMEAAKTGRSIDKMVEDDTTGAYGSTVKLVTVDIIVRILRQSWDGEPMSQESQSALGYNWSGTYAIPGGGIAAAIMRNDLKRLGLKQQRIRGIELYGPDQGDYSHFTG